MKNILIFLGIAAAFYWYKNRDKAPGTAPDNWLKSGLFGLFPTSATTTTTVTAPTSSVAPSSSTSSSSTDGNVYSGAGTDGQVAAASFTSLSKPKSAFQ